MKKAVAVVGLRSSRYRQFREGLGAVGGGLVGLFCSTIALKCRKRANSICVPNTI